MSARQAVGTAGSRPLLVAAGTLPLHALHIVRESYMVAHWRALNRLPRPFWHQKVAETAKRPGAERKVACSVGHWTNRCALFFWERSTLDLKKGWFVCLSFYSWDLKRILQPCFPSLNWNGLCLGLLGLSVCQARSILMSRGKDRQLEVASEKQRKQNRVEKCECHSTSYIKELCLRGIQELMTS